MDDDVEVYENCFCYTRKVKEYSEPISYIHKIDDKTLQTSQPIIKSWTIVKTPLDSKVGNKIKLAKTDEEAFGLILFTVIVTSVFSRPTETLRHLRRSHRFTETNLIVFNHNISYE